MELEEQQRKNIVLGLRLVVTFLFLFLFGFLNYLPFYLKVPEAILITGVFSLHIVVLGLADLWGCLK